MAHKGMDIGSWTVAIILAVVLFAVLAGVYPSLVQQATKFKNSTSNNSMATVLVLLIPILIAAGVLIVFVFEFLPTRLHGRR